MEPPAYNALPETSSEARAHDFEEQRRAVVRPEPSRGGQDREGAGPREQDDRGIVHDAGTGATRTTGFSTIGKLISPDMIPRSIESHHTGS
jgi:hypothetical protein